MYRRRLGGRKWGKTEVYEEHLLPFDELRNIIKIEKRGIRGR